MKFAATTEFRRIDQQKPVCQRVCDSFLRRMEKCIEMSGLQFEPLLWSIFSLVILSNKSFLFYYSYCPVTLGHDCIMKYTSENDLFTAGIYILTLYMLVYVRVFHVMLHHWYCYYSSNTQGRRGVFDSRFYCYFTVSKAKALDVVVMTKVLLRQYLGAWRQ